jgi:hypothetical protein
VKSLLFVLLLAGIAPSGAGFDRSAADAPARESAQADETRAEASVPQPGEAETPKPAAEAPRPSAPIPFDLLTYQVQIHVGFESDPQFDDTFRRSVLDGVREGLERYVGEFWRSTVVEEQGKIFAGLAALRRLRLEAVPKDAVGESVQKVFLLSVQSSGPVFRVAGREWDIVTRQLGEVAFQSTSERDQVSEALLAAVRDVFRPLAAVETTKSGAVTLRARGGEFPPRDASWQPLPPGRTFEVYYGFLDKARAIERVQQVPFTYLMTRDETGRGVALAEVASGLRAPLVARRRIQILALGINRRSPGTQLTMITRPPARKPLGGVEVEVSPDPVLLDDSRKTAATHDGGPARDEPDAEQGNKDEHENQPSGAVKFPRLVADRSGAVHLSAGLSPTGQPVWLFVRSGQALLARVPIVPGAQAAEVLELPDDSLRLEIEGSITTLQAELVDTVARRAVLMALARARAKAGQWEEMTAALRQLEDMPKAASFAVNINAIRQPALKSARARRDRTTEERVRKLCDEALELVTNYLDEEKLKELKEELNEMRQIAADEAAAEAKAAAGGEQPAPKPPRAAKAPKTKPAAPAAGAARPNPPAGF